LMLLPGTNLGSKESVEKWGMQTKYRIIPRCYGYYDCNGEQINAAEIERIVVANNALSFEDYLDCRRMHFIVNLFYNDSVFDEVLNLLRILDIPKYAWIELIHRYSQNSGFNKLMDKFIDETQGELWSSHESLDTFIKQRENIELFINGDLGANIIFSNRAYGMINYLPDLAAVATATLTDLLAENQVEQSVIDFGAELVRFAQMRMTNIFNDLSEPLSGNFDFDVVNFAQDTEATSLDKYLAVTPRKLEFHLEQNQVRSVTSYLQAYGDTIAGRSRILATVFVGKLLRNPSTQFLEHQA